MTQVTEPPKVSARGDAWRAIPVMHDRVIGRQRHIVGAGQKVAACGAGVTTSTLWVVNRNKGKCADCLELAPDPDNTAVIGVRTDAQREAQRILDKQPRTRDLPDMPEDEYKRLLAQARAVRQRHEAGGWGHEQHSWGRRDEETRTRPEEKPEWDLRYGFGYPDMPVTERPPAGYVSEDKVVHTNPHVRLAHLDRRLDWADRKVTHAVEDLDKARSDRDKLREQIIAARQEAGLCVRCGEQRCTCEGEEKG
jgi:hypothetical protein